MAPGGDDTGDPDLLRGRSLWRGLTVIETDMRVVFDPSFKGSIDIVVSELLGSFGDNELSPECLDGVNWLLNDHSISIPQSYSSFLAPISYSKGWQKLRDFQQNRYFETIYVVNLSQHHILSRPKQCFTFNHPNSTESSNERNATVTFTIENSGYVFGFGGYFTAVLYDDVVISINPDTLEHSPDIFSWFPCYIPIQNPFLVQKRQKASISIFRLTSKDKVWYQWCVTEPFLSRINT